MDNQKRHENTQVKVNEAIDLFEQQIADYKAGKLTDDEFRKKRLWMGIYKELGFFMQRVKLPYGRVTSPQLRAMADLTKTYSKNLSHLTTRQDLEFHWLQLDDLGPACRKLWEVGLNSREGCGDTVRNITADFRAGYLKDEVFDIRPYAEALYHYFLLKPENQNLPRKFKISFSCNAEDGGLAVIHDIGLIPVIKDGEQGFRLLAAGGLGKTPNVAHEVRPFISFQELIPACEAIIQLFHDHGNRENRKRARLKYVVMERGVEAFNAEFERLFAERLAAAKGPFEFPAFEEPIPAGPATAFDAATASDKLKEWVHINTIEQKQAGYYIVVVPVELGDVTSEQLNDLADMVDKYSNGHARVTQAQKFVFSWIKGQDLPALHAELDGMGLALPEFDKITDIVACPGTDFCEIGFASSIGMAKTLKRHLLARNGDLDSLGRFRIHISGCTNSCGQHHIGNIGLIGYRDVRGGITRDLFQMLIGGGVDETGKNVIGEKFGLSMAAEEIPGWVDKLLDHYLANKEGNETFKEFVVRVGAKNLTDVLGAKPKKKAAAAQA